MILRYGLLVSYIIVPINIPFPQHLPGSPQPPRRRADAHRVANVQLGGAEAAEDGAAGEPLHRELRRIGHRWPWDDGSFLGVLAGMRILHV